MADFVREIKDRLPKLSGKQLDEVRQFATLLANGPQSKVINDAKDEDVGRMIIQTICDVMKGHGAEFTGATTLLKPQNSKAFYVKVKDDGLAEFLRNVTKRNKVAMQALVHLSIELLYSNMHKMKIETSSRTMMNHTHRIPAVLNEAFPGYADAGMLHMVIRAEEKNNVRQERNSRATLF